MEIIEGSVSLKKVGPNAEALADAEDLEKQMQELFPNVPTMLTGIGTVLAAHLGPGAIGVFVRRKA